MEAEFLTRCQVMMPNCIEYVQSILDPDLDPSVKQSIWERNSKEIILLMTCLQVNQLNLVKYLRMGSSHFRSG